MDALYVERSAADAVALLRVTHDRQSLGGNGGGGLGDLQVAAGVGQHDQLRCLARGARNR